MKISEFSAVRLVARLSPWISPIPSAFFIGRSVWVHLLDGEHWSIKGIVAVIAGLVVELLSVAAFHHLLDLMRWNRYAESKKWERANILWPWLAVGLYVVGVVVLLLVLEVEPGWVQYSYLLWPVLSSAGVIVLSSVGQHDDRKARYGVNDWLKATKPTTQESEVAGKLPERLPKLPKRRLTYMEALQRFPDLLKMDTEKARQLAGVSERTIRNWRRNGHKK